MKEESELENKVDTLSTQLAQSPNDEKLLHKYEHYKKELEIKKLNTTRGAIIRARVKWTEEGEKNTKYFLNLEKKRAESNTIKQVTKDNGEIVTGPSKILVEAQKYYENLYKKDKSTNEADKGLNSFSEGITYKKLQDEEKESCEADITLEEIGEALQQNNNDSAPGSDGITKLQNFLAPFEKSLYSTVILNQQTVASCRPAKKNVV